MQKIIISSTNSCLVGKSFDGLTGTKPIIILLITDKWMRERSILLVNYSFMVISSEHVVRRPICNLDDVCHWHALWVSSRYSCSSSRVGPEVLVPCLYQYLFQPSCYRTWLYWIVWSDVRQKKLTLFSIFNRLTEVFLQCNNWTQLLVWCQQRVKVICSCLAWMSVNSAKKILLSLHWISFFPRQGHEALSIC